MNKSIRIEARTKFSGLHVDLVLLMAVTVAVLGLAQFAIAVPRAMNAYPGGTLRDRTTSGYSWTENWISDLGRETAWNSQPNETSSLIFGWSMIALGGSLLIFFLVSHRATQEFTFATFGMSAGGVLAAIGLIGIGLTPYDKYCDLHNVMLLQWILSMIAVAGTFGYQAIRGGVITGIMIVAASTILFIGLIFYGLTSSTPAVFSAQKAFVIISIAWFILLVARIGLTTFYVVVETLALTQLVNGQADEYMRDIKHEHLKRTPR